MKIEIAGIPEFRIPLTLDQVSILMELSKVHYDQECRQASADGGIMEPGFIYVWSKIIALYYGMEIPDVDDADRLPIYVQATWRQLDTLNKILVNAQYIEDAHRKARAMCLRWDLIECLSKARPIINQWKAEIETLESFRRRNNK